MPVAKRELKTSFIEPYSWWEGLALSAILVGFIYVCHRLILQNVTFGQDFPTHQAATEAIIKGPSRWLAPDASSRPLVYWVGRLVQHFRPGDYRGASYVFSGLTALALFFAYDASRRVILSPLIRLCATAFIAFLPQTLIATVVYSADALVPFFFVLAGWALVRASEAKNGSRRVGWSLATGLALAGGVFTKAHFIFPALGVVLALAAYAAKDRLPWKSAVIAAAAAVVLPVALNGWLSRVTTENPAGLPAPATYDLTGTGEMTFRSLLLIKPYDRQILEAPPFYHPHPVPGSPDRFILPLIVENGFSYPALLHLGTFTDVLNYSKTKRGGIEDRPEPQQSAARGSVIEGLPFSILAVVALFAAWRSLLRGTFGRHALPAFAVIVFSLFGLLWFLPLAAVLPFIHHSYGWGYWQARVVLPALWVFFFGAFALVDSAAGGRRNRVGGVILAITLIQITNEVRSVWYG